MSKRKSSKSRKKPNLSADVLERARREVYGNGAVVEAEKTVEDTTKEADSSVKPKRDKPKVTVASGGVQKRMLTSAELAEEYYYVIADLRSMALLAGLLFIAMVVVSILVI